MTQPFRYLDLCSGISAAHLAFSPLGWECAAFAEIAPFPSAVLAYRFPGIRNLGDIWTIQREDVPGPVDLIVAGTACQSFSSAGNRKGLEDPRGQLVFAFLRLVELFKPRWVVFENVPGLLSQDQGRAFGALLGRLAECGMGIAWRILDSRFHGVPQRRRRVFVVGYSGDWTRAGAVLFEPKSLLRNSQTSPKAREETAGPAAASTGGAGRPIAFGGNNTSGPIDVATARNAHGGPHGRLDFESETFLVQQPVAFSHQAGGAQTALGFFPKSGTSPPLSVGQVPAVAFAENSRHELRLQGGDGQQVGCLRAGGGGKPGQSYPAIVDSRTRIRRLTPLESERLQGFPDDFTKIPYRGKPAEECPDGPRLQSIGNSITVPVLRWIGAGINVVDRIRD